MKKLFFLIFIIFDLLMINSLEAQKKDAIKIACVGNSIPMEPEFQIVRKMLFLHNYRNF